MKNKITTAMSLGIINRRTGEVRTSVPFPDHENPHILPPADTFIWHYIKFEFFQSLLSSRALYLSRMDCLSDKTDGMFAAANQTSTTPIMQRLANSSGLLKMENDAALFPANDILRRMAFVHCWSIRRNESPRMWHAFLGDNSRSIAIRTTVGRLQEALRDQPVELARVIYYAPGKCRPDWSHSAAFLAKDREMFEHERELRIIHTLDISKHPENLFKLIPVNFKSFSKIVVHPLSDGAFAQEVRSELAKARIHAMVRRSSLGPSDLMAFKASNKS